MNEKYKFFSCMSDSSRQIINHKAREMTSSIINNEYNNSLLFKRDFLTLNPNKIVGT